MKWNDMLMNTRITDTTTAYKVTNKGTVANSTILNNRVGIVIYNLLRLFLDSLLPISKCLLLGLSLFPHLISSLCALPRQSGQNECEQIEHSACTNVYTLAGDEQFGHLVLFIVGAGLLETTDSLCSCTLDLRKVSIVTLFVCFLVPSLTTSWFSSCFWVSETFLGLVGSLPAIGFREVQKVFQWEQTNKQFNKSDCGK